MTSDQTVRRIITSQRPTGESVVAVDEELEPTVHSTSGLKYWPIWGRDDVTHLPYGAVPDHVQTFFPSTAAGFRAHVVEFPAKGAPREEGRGEWPDKGLADGHFVDPNSEGMHWTDTVDIVIVLSGEIGLVHDDGTAVTLRPGTVVVQNGANHAWRPSDVPCRVCFVNLGAERSG